MTDTVVDQDKCMETKRQNENAMNESHVCKSKKIWLLAGLLLVLSIQGLVRFSIQPAVGLVLDDWAFLSGFKSLPSTWGGVFGGLHSPTRPLSAIPETMVWRLFSDWLAPYAWYSLLGYSMAVAFVFLLVRELTGKASGAFVAVLLFVVLPNVCGHFHWMCLLVGQGQLPYLLAVWLLARYARRGGLWTLGGALFAYAVGLGSYEVGAFFPAACAVLLWRRGWKKCVAVLFPFGVAFGVYAAWRLTAGFGLGRSSNVAPQFEPGMTWYTIKHTAAGIVSWWGGLNWWRAIGDGVTGFSELPWMQAALLLLANAGLVVLSGLWLWNTRTTELTATSDGKTANTLWSNATLVVFGMAWVAATYLPVFLGYLAPRLNYLPGAGVAFLVALVLDRMKMERWFGLLLVLVFMGMVVGEGDTKNWSDTIRFQRNLFETMKERRAEWEGADVFWLDTRDLAHRLTPGLLSGNRHHIDTIAEYRNTGLLRGFGPSAMASLIMDGQPGPQVILDVEYGAHEENGILKWHERYNPDKPMETPMERVYRMDAFAAGIQKGADDCN